MIFIENRLCNSYIIEAEKLNDERGFFARAWDRKIFEEKGLDSNLVQCNISFNKTKGTLRGLHYQAAPYEEAKIIRCTSGKIFIVIVDLRKDSKTFRQWEAFELNYENRKMLYVPKGFAVGYQTLEDNTEVFYQMSQYYMPGYARGIRWDDPSFNITWPIKPTIISEKDLSYSFQNNF